MNKALLLSVCALFSAGAAFGQAGVIGLYFDNPSFTDCDYVDSAPALVPVYVVHHGTTGVTASQFMVEPGSGFTCVYTGEIIAVPVSIGSTQTGLSASYGSCLSAPILIATINYFCQGTSPTCTEANVVPDPAAPTGTIEVVDCSFTKLEGRGVNLIMNPDGNCECGGGA